MLRFINYKDEIKIYMELMRYITPFNERTSSKHVPCYRIFYSNTMITTINLL